MTPKITTSEKFCPKFEFFFRKSIKSPDLFQSLDRTLPHTMANLPYMPGSRFIDAISVRPFRPSPSWALSSSRTTRPLVNYPAFNSNNAISTDFHPELRVLLLVCLCSCACARVLVPVCMCPCACARRACAVVCLCFRACVC